jgi:hypothetical protein
MGTHAHIASIVVALVVPLGASAQPTPEPSPIITEVLYAVPKGDEGDASHDGSRDATGDEFVEIYNPTEKPISLTGWTLTDRNAPDSGQFLFRFPSFTLGSGETVVVFNGLEQKLPEPVGSADKPPEKVNERFSGAWVFSAGNTSKGVGFANDGDWVCLRDPQSKPVACVMWGDPDGEPPLSGEALVEAPNTSVASVQRTLATAVAAFEPHPSADGLRCSPGKPPPPGDDETP